MIVSLRRWAVRIKYALLFLALTYALYHALDALSAWMEPLRYRPPGGQAVKAFQPGTVSEAGYESVAERLRIFYWYGE